MTDVEEFLIGKSLRDLATFQGICLPSKKVSAIDKIVVPDSAYKFKCANFDTYDVDLTPA